MFGVLIEDLSAEDLPQDLIGTRQIVRLAAGRDHVMLRVVLPFTHEEAHVTFSVEDLQRLKYGLEEAHLDAKYFAWPPLGDSDRPPYRGLPPVETEDVGIFFGRDDPITRPSTDCAAYERLRHHGSSSFPAHQARENRLSRAPAYFRGSSATTGQAQG